MPKRVSIVNSMVCILTVYILIWVAYGVYSVKADFGWWEAIRIAVYVLNNIMIIYGIYKAKYWVVTLIFITSIISLLSVAPAVLSSIFVSWPGYNPFIYYLFSTFVWLFAICVFWSKEVRCLFVKGKPV
jgi:hypothetical protein